VAESMPPLDPRVLAELRVESAPPPETQARVRTRLEAQIPALRRTSRGPNGQVGSTASLGRFAIHVTTFVLGGVAGAGVFASLQHPPAPQIVYVDRPAPAPVSPPPIAVPSTAPTAIPTPPPKAVVGSPSGESLSGPSQLAAERRLLDSARSVLVGGDPNNALSLLDAHRARFPRGVLAEERDALSIQALVKAGRNDEARTQAQVFRERSPDSLFSSAVESAIESISVTGSPP
jgi:hypothetical protein